MEKYKRGDIVGIERENERDENYKSTKNPQNKPRTQDKNRNEIVKESTQTTILTVSNR